jgi:hypothetical protein
MQNTGRVLRQRQDHSLLISTITRVVLPMGAFMDAAITSQNLRAPSARKQYRQLLEMGALPNQHLLENLNQFRICQISRLRDVETRHTWHIRFCGCAYVKGNARLAGFTCGTGHNMPNPRAFCA